jgi:hypothetical protein
MVKLNQNTCTYIGHMTIPIVMKKLYERQESGPRRFLLAHISEISWISCVNSGNFLKISGIVPSLYRMSFPPWANEKKPYGARKKCSSQIKGLIQAQNRKITMTYSENRKFFHSVTSSACPLDPSARSVASSAPPTF